jgi:hypothetical protein
MLGVADRHSCLFERRKLITAVLGIRGGGNRDLDVAHIEQVPNFLYAILAAPN